VASDRWREKRFEERSRSLRCGRDDRRGEGKLETRRQMGTVASDEWRVSSGEWRVARKAVIQWRVASGE